MPGIPDTYQKLVSTLKRQDTLGSVQALLGWDEQVNLPSGSAALRAEQSALLAEIAHEAATRPEIGEWIAVLQDQHEQLDPGQQAVLRDAARDYRRATGLPPAFVARKSKAQSAGFHAWLKAREDGDFNSFAPHLVTQLELAQEEASLLEAPDAYDYWLDQFDPGLTRSTVERLFTPLQKELKALVESIDASGIRISTEALKGFPVEDQEAFLHEVVEAMGFDRRHGRIDRSVHPFCGGHPLDVRMTTRYAADNPLDSLSSVMHECGHALYEQGLPREHHGTALGEAAGMAVHESQSRLWENQVGRSRAFWKAWEPAYRSRFSTQLQTVSSEELYRMVNRVAVSPIRVDADEVTYNLHIMLRFELEKRFFDGSLDPRDLPEAWNEASRRILGYSPKNHGEGCLQDVHWSEGLFGYFPSYTVGNLIAAQLWQTLRSDLPKLDEQIAQRNLSPLLQWLREQVHQLAGLHRTEELVRTVTGEPISHRPLMEYLHTRYDPIYGLD